MRKDVKELIDTIPSCLKSDCKSHLDQSHSDQAGQSQNQQGDVISSDAEDSQIGVDLNRPPDVGKGYQRAVVENVVEQLLCGDGQTSELVMLQQVEESKTW